jgi:hypothetical protein
MERKCSKILFLVWASSSIRAHSISRLLGARLYLLSTSPVKHPVLFVKTLQILLKERPTVIICQSPPISCALVAIIYSYFFSNMPKPKIVIDAHTGAISRPWFRHASMFIMKRAYTNIVNNNELQNDISQKYGVKSIVLEDPIPDIGDKQSSSMEGHGRKIHGNEARVAVIYTGAYDEPIEAVFDAASELSEVRFYITGNKSKFNNKLMSRKPDNIILTGFLNYDEYIPRIQQVDVIIDLTTDDKSMQAGAYEAVALEQPLITSNWNPLKRYFYKGTIHVDNSPEDIIRAIRLAQDEKEELREQMRHLKIEKINEFKKKINEFKNLLTTEPCY